MAKRGRAAYQRWRPPLFRALREGSMLEVERLITENPQCMHQYMTSEMEEWELQWECQHWYQMTAVTPLYIAAAYAQAEAVRWLLDRGADVTMKCYHGQTALDVVGEFAPPTRHDDVLRCKELLKGPKRVPIPPNDPSLEAKISSLKEVLVEVGEDCEEGELQVVSQSATATVRGSGVAADAGAAVAGAAVAGAAVAAAATAAAAARCYCCCCCCCFLTSLHLSSSGAQACGETPRRQVRNDSLVVHSMAARWHAL